MKILHFPLVPLCLGAFLIGGAPCVHSAPQKSPAKKTAPKKTAPKKTAAPKAPVAAGQRVVPKGEGAMQFDGTFTNRGANLLGNSYSAVVLDKYKHPASKGTAAFNNGIAVVVLLTGTLPDGDEDDEIRVAFHLTGAFSSKVGFYTGQKINIALPAPNPEKISSQAFFEFSQTEIKKPKRKYGDSKTRSSSWVAKSGTLEVTGVSPQRISFTIKNALFTVLTPKQERNFATGSFVFNGKGGMTIPVDDGFR